MFEGLLRQGYALRGIAPVDSKRGWQGRHYCDASGARGRKFCESRPLCRGWFLVCFRGSLVLLAGVLGAGQLPAGLSARPLPISQPSPTDCMFAVGYLMVCQPASPPFILISILIILYFICFICNCCEHYV
jgi:hypothetical protein